MGKYSEGGRTMKKIFYNANIITVESDDPLERSQVMIVEDDKILDLGDDDLLHKYSEIIERVDMKGRTIVPGFYDAHGHFSIYCETLNKVNLSSPPVGTIKSIKDLQRKLEDKVKETPAGEWIYGYGLDESLLEEKRYPTKNELDAVTTEHPIWITHTSLHAGVANSLAFEYVGVKKNTCNPTGGLFEKDAVSGQLTGLCEEKAMNYFGGMNLDMSIDERCQASLKGQQDYLKTGTTTACDGLIEDINIVHAYKKMIANDEFKLRIIINPSYEIFDNESMETIENNSHLTIGGVKVITEGSIQIYTAFLKEPYLYTGEREKNFRGYARLTQSEIEAIIDKVNRSGRQCIIHANGDETIETVINAIYKAQKNELHQDLRHTIMHCQLVTEEQLDKMKELEIVPSFFVLHVYYWGDRHLKVFLGKERAERIDPCNSAVKRRMPFSIHCDTPVVPNTPLFSMHTAVNRETFSGRILGEAQCISPYEALKAITKYAAYQNKEDHLKGSLAQGKYADFVVLDTDPLKCAKNEIKNIQVLATYIGGSCVYEQKVTIK